MLKRLVIHRFRHVVPGTKLEFSERFNVLLGKNGSGKTTLLNLISMVLRSDFSSLRGEEFNIEFTYADRHGTVQIQFTNEIKSRSRHRGSANVALAHTDHPRVNGEFGVPRVPGNRASTGTTNEASGSYCTPNLFTPSLGKRLFPCRTPTTPISSPNMSQKSLTLTSLLASMLISCASSPPNPEVPKKDEISIPARGALAADAVAGVSNEALKDLLDAHFDWELREAPTHATTLGDHRFDSQLRHDRLEDIQARQKQRKTFRDQAKAIVVGTLNADDKVTLRLLLEDLESDIASDVCAFESWELSSYTSPVNSTNHLPELHLVSTVADGQHLLARYAEIPRVMRERQDNLQRGLGEGRVASHESVKRLVAQLDRQLEKPVKDWSLVKVLESPAAKGRRKAFSAAEEQAFLADAARIVESRVAPAYRGFRDFISKEVLPKARPDDKEGVLAITEGAACYRARILNHLGAAYEPEKLHETGHDEIARINGEMKTLGKKLFGTEDLAAILEKLRTDKTLYFDSPQAVEEAARKALAKSRAAIPNLFGILPKADCVVSLIPDEEAPYTTIAYYREPNYDGSKPGEYFINTYKPEIRPRFEMEALSFHESIPGHHLQIAIAQERGSLPAFRKFGRATAFVEGWALYTEKLADESGLYSSDLDRLGMLSYDAWRASRLVVDTGLHHLGWTRAKAEQYMREHTALTPSNIENEVDRYIAWPGQALAYKVGQLEILRLRQHAKDTLGTKFDLKGFHDAVLSGGPVSLPVLQEQIETWIASRR